MLRVVKEEAEKPEKEAKDQHQKLWEAGCFQGSAGAGAGSHCLPGAG